MGSIRRAKHGPEWYIQNDLIPYLEARSWLVERMIGNAFQMGIPDLYAYHSKWGARWIDVKVAGSYTFTKAQKRKWPIWDSFGVGIWILTAANQEQYDLLFQSPNWRKYWNPKWGEIPTLKDIDNLLDQITDEPDQEA